MEGQGRTRQSNKMTATQRASTGKEKKEERETKVKRQFELCLFRIRLCLER